MRKRAGKAGAGIWNRTMMPAHPGFLPTVNTIASMLVKTGRLFEASWRLSCSLLSCIRCLFDASRDQRSPMIEAKPFAGTCILLVSDLAQGRLLPAPHETLLSGLLLPDPVDEVGNRVHDRKRNRQVRVGVGREVRARVF